MSRRDLLRAGAAAGAGAALGGLSTGVAPAHGADQGAPALHDLGSIERGKLADLLVLDRDYFGVSDAAMRETRPVLTVVGGEVVHDTGDVRIG